MSGRRLALTVVGCSLGVAAVAYFLGPSFPMISGLKRLWWRLNYTPTQVEMLEKLQQLEEALQIVDGEYATLTVAVKNRTQPLSLLEKTILTLSDDVDYVLKALDTMDQRAKLPVFAKEMRKQLARQISNVGDKVDSLQRQLRLGEAQSQS